MNEDEVTTPTPEDAGEQAPEKQEQPDYLKLLPQAIQNHINDIKARGIDVFMTFLADRGYLIRSIKVLEWMKLQKEQEQRAKADGATEEWLQQKFFESLVFAGNLGIVITNDDGVEELLDPINRETIQSQPAGVPQSLAQEIMKMSGFDSQPMTIKL